MYHKEENGNQIASQGSLVTPFLVLTPVSANKICFQVMSEKEVVSAFFSSCVHAENLTIGLYCIEGNVKTLSKKEGSINPFPTHDAT
ncbi:unnamed protein product [Ranitomeya imitator]|uniref:Uncharacterized protein n=1 Tax=Ranitomeya imitator TaxID=111125 RepID=A0ABN9MJK0_9NEOB|nr:unnamed protein product [Ranitomeya imitator]